MRVREYRDEDWAKIEDPIESCSISGDLPTIAGENIAYTAEHGGRPIVCGGIIVDGDKGYFWVRLSRESVLMPLKLVKMLKTVMDILSDSLDNPQLYAHVLEGFTQGERFARFFGFKKTDDYIDVSGHRMYIYRKR